MNYEKMNDSLFLAGSIGRLLVDSGRITKEQAEKILATQEREGLRFGDAAIKLGFIKQSDIQFALSQQFFYPYIEKNDSSFSPDLIAAYDPYTPEGELLRTVRGQIIQEWMIKGNKSFLVTNCNSLKKVSSYIAANLAVLFAQLGERTLLVDANLRNPQIHKYFKLQNKKGLSDILADRAQLESINVIEKLQGLSVLTSGTEAPNPQELIAKSKFDFLHELLKENYDVIIIDTPDIYEYTDGQIIAARTKGVLLVAEKDKTSFSDFNKASLLLKSAGANVFGSVLAAMK